MGIMEKMLKGDNLSLSRLISMIEREDIAVSKLMKVLNAHTGKAYCLGITGPLGLGKKVL